MPDNSDPEHNNPPFTMTTTTTTTFHAVDAFPKAECVFPKGPNASPLSVSRLLDGITAVSSRIHATFQTGLQNIVTQFKPIPICRESHHIYLSELAIRHLNLRASITIDHHHHFDNLKNSLIHLEKSRRALVNAKRVRNTQNNQLRSLLSYMRIEASNRNAIFYLLSGGSEVTSKHCASSQQIKAIDQMIEQNKQNYRNAAKNITHQIWWNYDVILKLLTQLQENVETSLKKIKESAADCRQQEQKSLDLALHEFSVEQEWRRALDNNDVIVHAIQYINNTHYIIIEEANTYRTIERILIKNFKPETHCNPEFFEAFRVAQEEAAVQNIQGTTWVYSDDADYDYTATAQQPPQSQEFDEEICETDILTMQEEQDQYQIGDEIQLEFARPVSAHRRPIIVDEDATLEDILRQSDINDLGGPEIDPENCATGHTPKASLKSGGGGSHKRDSRDAFACLAAATSNTKSKKSKKSTKTFEPLRIVENTNHTTGTLREEECVSKKDYDAQCQTHLRRNNQNCSSSKSSNGAFGGRCTKNEFERWNKKKAASKMMSWMFTAE